jgi:hypothetical protein
MARTRAQLDRSGNYVSPAAGMLRRAPPMNGGSPVAMDAPVITRRVRGYRADRETFGKAMTAWELARLLDMHMGGKFVLEMTPEAFDALPGDLRQHFMPVWEGNES